MDFKPQRGCAGAGQSSTRISGRALSAAALAVLLTVTSIATTAHAQDDAYRRLAEEATRAMAERHLDEAVTLFREMHAMAPSARTLWSLGRVHYEQAEYVVALDYLEQALVDPRRPLEGAALEEATSLRDRARALTAEVQVESTPPGAAVLVDDVEMPSHTFRLDPGDHTIRLELTGYAPGVRRIVVRGGEHTSVSVVLSPLGGLGVATGPRMGPVVHDITIEVASDAEPLTLHLQPLSVSGSGGAFGDLEAICETPCTHTVRSGTYGGAVSRADGDPVVAWGAMLLETDSRIEIELHDNSGVRIGFGVALTVGLLYGVIGSIVGGLALDRSSEIYDSGVGIALLTSAISVGTLALVSLAFAFTPDDAAIRVAPR